MFNDYLIFARKMLDTTSLPQELENRLNRINNFVQIANDDAEYRLRSSQVVAMVVEQYLREQDDITYSNVDDL